jgi:hypothetical protein
MCYGLKLEIASRSFHSNDLHCLCYLLFEICLLFASLRLCVRIFCLRGLCVIQLARPGYCQVIGRASHAPQLRRYRLGDSLIVEYRGNYVRPIGDR